MTCLNPNTVTQFVHGNLAAAQLSDAEEHLDSCPTCRRLVAVLAQQNSELRTQSGSPEPQIATKALLPGTVVGRYIVEELIGAGGMGVVYRAEDPELKRSVALKVLRSRAAATDVGEARLAREAQLIAQVSHPNVVQVYDVGVVDNRVFIAMEFVEGQTATDWCRHEKRSWQDVVQLFIQAGKGLEAAHEAGLVHRDFKPDNILIGADGRVCVSDFGLARDASAETEFHQLVDATNANSTTSLATETATILGTPAYMAPEQHQAAAADARADQFSFCVSLYELLYGHRPFAGDTLAELRDCVVNGEIENAPPGRLAPKWLHTTLLRGLRGDRDERFPSMQALLNALERGTAPASISWYWVALMIGVALSATIAIATMYGDDSAKHATCSGGEEEIAEVWNEDVRNALASALTALDLPFAEASAKEVQHVLDERSAEWAQMRRSACEETRVQGTQSEQLLDLRMACLDEQRSEFAELVSILKQSDRETLKNVVDAAHALTPLDRCANTLELLAPDPLPSDPQTRKQLAEIRQGLAAARAAVATRSVEGLTERIEQAISKATELNYKPVLAEALYAMARLNEFEGDYEIAEQNLRKVVAIADSCGHDELRARAWVLRVDVAGDGLEDPVRALELAELAEAAVVRSGGDPDLRANLLDVKGIALARQGHDKKAIALLEQVLELRSQGPGSSPSGLIKALSHLGVTLSDLDAPRALELLERALALAVEGYGESHPNVALNLTGIAGIQWRLGDGEKALGNMKRAVKIYEASLRPNHPLLGSIYGNTAIILESLGRIDDSIALHRKALGVSEAALGADHPSIAGRRLNLGSVLSNSGRTKEAAQEARLAVAIFEKSLGKHRETGRAHQVLGQILIEDGLYAEAIAPMERALEIYEDAEVEPRDIVLAETRFFLAIALDGDGRKEAYVNKLMKQAESACPNTATPHSIQVCGAIAGSR